MALGNNDDEYKFVMNAKTLQMLIVHAKGRRKLQKNPEVQRFHVFRTSRVSQTREHNIDTSDMLMTYNAN